MLRWFVRVTAAALLVVALLAAVAAGGASAAGWKLESSSSVSLRTDGVSFAVWDGPKAHQTTIYKTDTGARRVVSFPSGCSVPGGSPDERHAEDGAAAGRALLICNATRDTAETASVFDLRTGALTLLPGEAALLPNHSSVYQYRDIGAHWAKGSRSAGCDPAACRVVYRYMNLDSGQQVDSGQDFLDLDEPTLPAACGRLHAYAGRLGLLGVDQDSFYSSRKRGQRSTVRRVGCTAITNLTSERLPALSFQAAGGVVSWTTAREATNYSDTPRRNDRVPAIVAVASTTGGAVQRWRAPVHILHTPGDDEHLRGSYGIVAHTHRRIFFLSALRLDTEELDYVTRAALYSRPVGR